MKKLRLISLPNLKEAARRKLGSAVKFADADVKLSVFLASWGQGKHFCIRTYGCQANVRDSEILRSFLLKMNMEETDDFLSADLIIFNTCAVRENAENHLYGELGLAKDAYNRNHDIIIAVCGCVMQEEAPVRYVLDHFPFVSLIFGTNNINAFYELLEDCLKNNERLVDVKPDSDLIYEGFEENQKARLSNISAFVNIMYGCDKFCTYCIVPYTRGRERSRKEEDILNEVIKLKELGYKQITLLGQNVDAYGKDFNDPTAFANLLDKVAKTGIERIRFVTPYPSDFNTKVFDVMADNKNIMPSLHMPLQSGSDRILKKMNRRYTREEYLNIIHELRKRLPYVFLTTDIIVGFPGETEEDFNDTLSLVKEVEFDAAYTFIFSPRKGTPAARMLDDTSDEVKHQRFDILKKTIDELSTKSAQRFVGKTYDVLFETFSKRDKRRLSGYTPEGKLVHVEADPSLIGSIKKVYIKESHTYSLIGELVDE